MPKPIVLLLALCGSAFASLVNTESKNTSVEFSQQPFELRLNLFPSTGNATLNVALDDLFAITSVSSGTIQWFGEMLASGPGSTFGTGDVGIGQWFDFWPGFKAPLITSFIQGQSLPVFVHADILSACCVTLSFSLSNILVFDANGNLVQNPEYASSSGYLYPVQGSIQAAHMPEPKTWTVVLLGLIALSVALRQKCDGRH